MRILITGGAGYIGSMLSTFLVKNNFKVTVVDNFFFKNNYSLNHLLYYKNFKLVKSDILEKKFIKNLIKKFDIIIPLAALVGAPLCDKFKKKSVEINHNSIKFLIENMNSNQKIIYMNSNSGYGVGERNSFCTEESPMNPISLYGVTKLNAEREVLKFSNYIIFRLATVFGVSYRMRPELLVNNFVYRAFKKNRIDIFEPNFRRNFVHVRDVVLCILYSIKNFNKLKNNIFNLGLSNANLTKLKLAKKIKKKLPNTYIKIFNNKSDPDKRDYYVSNQKLEKFGFKATISLDRGIDELIKYYKFNSILKANY
jgi:nucleoside-diphosphate-sugar epimerase